MASISVKRCLSMSSGSVFAAAVGLEAGVWQVHGMTRASSLDSLDWGALAQAGGRGMPRQAYVSMPDSIARLSVLDFKALPKDAAESSLVIGGKAAKSAGIPYDACVADSAPGHCRDAGIKAVAAVARHCDVADVERALSSRGLVPARISVATVCVLNALSLRLKEDDFSAIVLHPDFLSVAFFNSGAMDYYRCKTRPCDTFQEISVSYAYYHGVNPGRPPAPAYLVSGEAVDAAMVREACGAVVVEPRHSEFIKAASNINDVNVVELLSAIGAGVGADETF